MKSTSRACICLAVVVRQPGTSQSPVSPVSPPRESRGQQGRCLEVPLVSLTQSVASVPTQGARCPGNNDNYAVTMIPTQGHSQVRRAAVSKCHHRTNVGAVNINVHFGLYIMSILFAFMSYCCTTLSTFKISTMNNIIKHFTK